MTTIAEKKHFGKLAEFGCILCYRLGRPGTPAEIHHIRHGGKRCNAPVIPLCPEHHRGDSGVHGLGRKAFNRAWGTTEEALLKLLNRVIA